MYGHGLDWIFIEVALKNWLNTHTTTGYKSSKPFCVLIINDTISYNIVKNVSIFIQFLKNDKQQRCVFPISI